MSPRYFLNPYPDYTSEASLEIDSEHVHNLIKNYVSQIENAKITESDLYLGNAGNSD